MRKMILISGFVLFVLCLNWGAAIAGGPWKGKIIDVETKEPLEGAVVLAVWYRVYRTPMGSSSYFYEAKETLTKKAGEFEIPSYTPINLLPIISYMNGPLFTIFKPGYGSINSLALGGYLTGTAHEIQDYEIEGKRFRFTLGIIELPPLKTWEERNKTNMISPYGDVPKNKWPQMNELLQKEEQWLRSNKSWRRTK